MPLESDAEPDAEPEAEPEAETSSRSVLATPSAGGDRAAQGPRKRRPGRPRSAPIEEQREIILSSARAVFAEHDYYGTSIDRVARRAGVARQLVYSLFGGKDELFITVVDDSCQHAIEQMTEQMLVSGPSAPPKELISACVRALFEFIGTRPEDAAILRIAEYGGFGPAKSEVMMARRRIEEGLAATFAVAWQGRSEISPQAARLFALMALSMVEAVGFRQPSEPEWDADATAQFLTEFLYGGMLRLDFRRTELESYGA